MPHINRIRVNNVKYNFGTQYYDDFMMRFSCRNTIYDLANGGGKSVLMLLLLQNLIPNCTLDEKQPVEKLFRTNSGSKTIHSLIEWKLDSCYEREGYRYMTTGFCARKGKSDEGSDEQGQTSIEYFNYVIFYREFGENDIKNLPLKEDGERITYQGLKNYLRELERRDKGVEVHIFERKGDYQTFIAQYGLFESQWEIIRGINKTEGHVRTYFENNYKTGRKVVEDLLIEEIIQKSFLNQIGQSENPDDEMMAKTLLEIKDRIILLSKRKSEIHTYDLQIGIMHELAEKILAFRAYEEEKEALTKDLLGKLSIAKGKKEALEEESQGYDLRKEEVASRIREEERLVAIAGILSDEAELEKLTALVEEYGSRLEKTGEEIRATRQEMDHLRALQALSDYEKYEALRKQVEISLDNRMRDHEEVYGEMAKLKAFAAETFAKIRSEKSAEVERLAGELEEAKEDYKRLRKEQENYGGKRAELLGERRLVQEQIEATDHLLRELSGSLGILVEEDARESYEAVEDSMKATRKELEEQEANLLKLQEKLQEARARMLHCESDLRVNQKRQEEFRQGMEEFRASEDKFQALSDVYGETSAKDLLKEVYRLYKNTLQELAQAEVEYHETAQYLENLNNGRYVMDGTQYSAVENYLFDTYGSDVLYGYEWLATLTEAQKRDVLKRIPMIDYCFVVKGDFDRIREDVGLKSFSHSSYLVPILSEAILRDTKHAANPDLIAFGTKDLSFLQDASKVNAEMEHMKEELYDRNEEVKKLTRRQEVLWEDYLYLLQYEKSKAREESSEAFSLKQEEKRLQEAYQEAKEASALLEEELKNCSASCSAARTKGEEYLRQQGLLEELLETFQKSRALHERMSSMEQEAKHHSSRYEAYEESMEKGLLRVENLRSSYQNAKRDLDLEEEKYRTTFSFGSLPTVEVPENMGLSYEEACVTFAGLASSLASENADVADKKTLIATYEESMEKSKKAMEDYGFTFEGLLEEKKAETRGPVLDEMTLKERLKRNEEIYGDLEREYDAQNAQKNRMEGSLAHARAGIESNYGSCTLPEDIQLTLSTVGAFLAQHQSMIRALQKERKDLELGAKEETKKLNEYIILARDLERTLQSAGVASVSQVTGDRAGDEALLSDVASVQKVFEKLVRNDYKKREIFEQDKKKLVKDLQDASGYDLAEEVERSIRIPDSVEEIDEMERNIHETCECILLEKNRVEKGIEDMERIKESFESRCIQTCANIRAELERLPKLSKITLDEEVISMIQLSIPYVREEEYRERMSAYIDETVELSEKLEKEADRMNYIRSRLTWKKLFSVIVTDMNGIRLNLYKRERIKDQSRYLRYEEAVGSTGQSQGIYIQFLVAIINYISNINAQGKEASVIGKVVFIDNPFGAAKDVYIWEPIFKLLKTNHVQLVVPARGVTPAISSRFEVNYILNQKLVNGRQQTVVADYRSQVATEELEYTRLEYTQASLFDGLEES